MEMNVSHALVHPVTIEAPPLQREVVNLPRVRMKDFQGMPGTIGGIFLRLLQFVFAVISLCVMGTTRDFTTASAFRYLVATAGLQSVWSLSLLLLDVYALLVGRCLQSSQIVRFFTIGDGVTSTLTFAAASAAAGITVFIGNDIGVCSLNHCTQFETSIAMAFICWFTALPSFLLNLWSLASR